MNNASHVLPRDKGAAPLDFVIAVMAFLAALALGASLIADRAAQGWQSGLAAKLTVQILPPDSGDARAGLDAQIRAALDILNAAPGVAHAALISDTDTEALVEPWIGKNNLVAEIPLPPADRRHDHSRRAGRYSGADAEAETGCATGAAGRSSQLDRAAGSAGRYGALFRLWHFAADRRRHRRSRVVRHAGGTFGPS